MSSVRVVVLFYDANDVQVASESGSVQFNPLVAGQRSPWAVLAPHDPSAARWVVEFQEAGQTVITRYGSSVP
jgi:hypothetical protein